MKKIIMLLLAVFLFTGCSQNDKSVSEDVAKVVSDAEVELNSDAEVEQNSDAEINTDVAAEDVVNENASVEYEQNQTPSLPEFTDEEEEVLYDLRGLLVNYEFMEEFRKTKSVLGACKKLGVTEYELLYDFDEDPYGYIISAKLYYEDCSSRVNAVENTGNGQYTVSLNNGGKIIYTPGKKTLESTIYGRPMEVTTGEPVKYERFMSYDDFIFQLTKILCEDAKGIYASREYGILGEIGGTRCSAKLVYSSDVLQTVHYGDERGTVEGIDISGYDGALRVEELTSLTGETYLAKYKYADGKLTIYDSENNVLATF